MGGRGGSSGGSTGGRVTKSTVSLGRGVTSTVYGVSKSPGVELQVVTRTDGRRAVATFYVPPSERGRGVGSKLMSAALRDGPIASISTGGVSDAYAALQKSLVRRGKAHVITDADGERLLVRGKAR